MQVPDLETRMTILKRLAETRNISISNSVIEFLAAFYNRNIRELEGAFNTVSAYTQINSIPLNVESVKKIIGYDERKKKVSINNIIETVADYYDVSSEDILSTSRMAKIAAARQIAIYLAKEITGESFPNIAKEFNRKHTTIMYAYKEVTGDIPVNKNLSNDINEIKNILNR